MIFILRVQRPCRRRAGATIIEVLFAIGVLLFGLVGIAVMIPAASQIARSSVDLDRGSSISKAVTAEFEARGMQDTSRWVGLDGTPVPLKVDLTPQTVCLDPLYASLNLSANSGASGAPAWFALGWFPYYSPTYNPLTDSTTDTPWPVMPRLTRGTVQTFGSTLPGGINAPGVPRTLVSSRFVDDTDQIVFDPASDRTMPPTQIFRPGSVAAQGGTPFPGARTDRAEYSWFATVQPRSNGFASANVVVVRGRDRLFPAPAIRPDEARKSSERIALVSEAVGGRFAGGTGGTVTLVASTAVDAKLDAGGWLMLIRNTNTVADPVIVHAWYRIVHSDREPTITTIADPQGGTTRAVWERSVMLEGPDWNFASASLANRTLAVLVDGAVAAQEFPVKLR